MVLIGWNDLESLKADFFGYQSDYLGKDGYEFYDKAAAEATAVFSKIEVLFAVYDSGGYEGHAFVLIRDGEKLYKIDVGHCSCYGLEGQWAPVEVTKNDLVEFVSLEYPSPSLYGCLGELKEIVNKL